MSLRVVMIAFLLLMAVALGLIAFQVGGPARPPPKAEAPPVPMSSYLITAHSLPPGTLARPEDFTVRTVPTDQLPPDVVIDSPLNRMEMRGALVRRFLEAGATLNPTDVTRPRDRGFLAAVLTPGTRAVSIGVDPISGVAGLIWPGDRVDVILTQDFPTTGTDSRRIVTSETILTNVRIIAVDQDIAQGAPVTGGAGKLAATVTLEVADDQAEKLTLSQRLGRLSLAVRSVPDPDRPITIAPGGVSGADVSDAFAKATGVTGPKVRIIEGDHRGEVNFK